MHMIPCSVATLVVATIFYAWRAYNDAQLRRLRSLRQRVAYMLWTMADQLE